LESSQGTVFAFAFNFDYSVLASGSEDEANVKLRNTATWREIRTLGEKKTAGLLEQLHPVAFSPDGKLIAAGFVGFDEKQGQYAYHRTYVWNAKTGEKLFTFEGHKLDIGALVFTPDNNFLISGSNDTTIKFWKLKSGQEARTLTQQFQREVAITFDDLPASRGEFKTMEYVTTNLLKSVEANKVPAVGFVNEGKLYVGGKSDSRRVALLEMWLNAGLELGNHTFSHVQINETPLAAYTKDVIRGEIITSNLLAKRGKRLRYFRHTQLRTGPTLEYKSELDKFISERGYTIAPVTIDNNENVIAQVYAKAKQDGDKETMKRVADAYIRYMEEIFAFFEKLSADSLGYEVKQTLLLHANELNADHFDDLVQMMRARDYKFISLEEALKDPAYSLPDAQVTKGLSWLHRWMMVKGDKMKPEPNVPEFISVLYNASADSVK
jgi:peptidoglycan/xylan/chitin deacetylase (PgdA/CDA1 family)